MGAAGFDNAPQPRDFGNVSWTSTVAMHRNVEGEVWGLVMGYVKILDWAPPAGGPPTSDPDAPDWYIGWEQAVTCFDVDLEGNKAWYMVEATHVNPVGFGQIGSVNAGFFQDNGGPGQDEYGVAGAGEPRFPDFAPECGARWEQAQLGVPETHSLRLIQH